MQHSDPALATIISPTAIAISTCNHSGTSSFLIITDLLSRPKMVCSPYWGDLPICVILPAK
jgi:hypothetical protein